MDLRKTLSWGFVSLIALGGAAPSLAQGDGDFQRQQAEQGLNDASRQMPRRDAPGNQAGYVRPGYQGERWRGWDGRGPYDRWSDPRWTGSSQYRWQRGDRLPPEFMSRNYRIDDWRSHRLSPPPRGYQWVQLGSDYALVSVGTGIIANVLLANR